MGKTDSLNINIKEIASFIQKNTNSAPFPIYVISGSVNVRFMFCPKNHQLFLISDIFVQF